MVEKEIKHFNLEQICDSGQCFRMKKMQDNVYVVLAKDRYIKIEQEGDRTRFYCSEEEFLGFWKEYFDVDNDYAAYMAAANPNDRYLNRAIAFGSGMRILRQDLWEMIVSFLISQQNNIVRIRRCIENICERYGEQRAVPGDFGHPTANGEAADGGSFTSESGDDDTYYYTFPEPEALCGLPEDALMECNLGYRSKYVVRAARSVVNGEFDPEAVSAMSYRKAKEELLKLFGVGEKVADCICLFGLHHLQAFPMDTHIKQAMAQHYKRGFPNRRYRGFQGVIQQYIFYYELCGKKKSRVSERTQKAGR